MLNRIFKLEKNSTTVSTEILAGITTFITMAYVLAIMPAMLAHTGMAKEAVFIATCLSAGVVTIAMGLIVNFPIALAPGMGLGAYFAAIAVQPGGIPWQTALGVVFIAGVIFLLLTVTRIRQILVDAIPDSLKYALTIGIGFFITLIGLKMSHLVVVNTHLGPSLDAIMSSHGMANLSFFEWDLTLGNFAQPDALLAVIGLVITSVLIVLKVRGGILLGIIITAIIGIPMGLTNIHDIHFSLPALSSLDFNAMDIRGAFNMGMASLIFTFTFVGLMDTFGTLVSTADKAGILKKENGSKLIGKAMFVDAMGACFGAFVGAPALTAYLESMAGISAGGRTGLTAVTTGILFLLALALSSLFIIIPNAATAPVLILIGAFMISSVSKINFEDFSEALPAFLTIIIMPLTYSIANGISAGILFYVLLKVVTGNWRKVHWMMYLLMLLIVSRFVFFN
ncbi:MAG: NCS2 family permease [Gammaproteobacteria bacterium]|nr:NCS2 family permease [Gammaproteobacteria bacterium]